MKNYSCFDYANYLYEAGWFYFVYCGEKLPVYFVNVQCAEVK